MLSVARVLTLQQGARGKYRGCVFVPQGDCQTDIMIHCFAHPCALCQVLESRVKPLPLPLRCGLRCLYG